MAEEFGRLLSSRIKSHDQFWSDLGSLQAASVWSLSVGSSLNTPINHPKQPALSRLMYSASIFAQASDEETRGLAQCIALCALITAPEPNLVQRSRSILASVGNYPAVTYLERQFKDFSSTLMAELRVELLKALNSVEIGGKELPLTEFQYDVWRSLPSAGSTAVSAPTSAGKSFLIIEYLCRKAASQESFTAIFLAPTRALLSEVQHKIETRLSGVPGVRVSTVPALDAQSRTKQIFVLTQERLQVLLSIARLSVDLLVVDEAQSLADGPRGMILQDCLERLRADNSNVQTILLAPSADGFGTVADLLGIPDMVVKETDLSPVQQNRIQVTVKEGSPKEFHLSLLTPNGATEIGSIATQRGVADRSTRLTAAALELGRTGAALVYATGPAEAEKIAAQFVADRPTIESQSLSELSKFIKEHIHPEYGLAAMVQHGITFHYGHMPTLLREALEGAFRDGHIQYLVCTTTLFQGVNLPARSVFINTPTRGKGTPLEAAHLWNFAGRAGRLGQELAGNVFLVDYEDWATKGMHQKAKYKILPAFSETVAANYDDVLRAVGGNMPAPNIRNPQSAQIRAAAGLLLARSSSDRNADFLERLPALNATQRRSIQEEAKKAIDTLNLPSSMIESNWTVDPFGLRRLADRMSEKIKLGEVDDLLPVHPNHPKAFDRYPGIFNRALRELSGVQSRSYGGLVATYAVPWMQGMPYPVMLNKWVAYRRKKNPNAKINDVIRKGFEFFEQVLRFQMVQAGKAYLDVLHYVLDSQDLSSRRSEAFDFPLALELGVSSTTGRSFIELGISRIAATTLEALFPDSELSPREAKEKIRDLDVIAVGLSPIIVDELMRLDLVSRFPE